MDTDEQQALPLAMADSVHEAGNVQEVECSGCPPLPAAVPDEASTAQQPDSALTADADEAVSAAVHAPAQLQQQQKQRNTADGTLAAAGVPANALVAADPTASLLQVISFNAAKRNNLHLLDDDTLLMGVGCMVLLLHLPTMKQRWLPGRDGGGVAAVAVHPSRQHFLVAERCKSRPPAM